MQTRMIVRIGLLGLFLVFPLGCQIWPFMSDEDGRRPVAMGKDDQVWYPYNPPTTDLSEDYGQSFRSARDNQILNPEASGNLEPVTEQDGVAADKSITRYREFYEKPPFTGTVGGTTGTGGGGGGS